MEFLGMSDFVENGNTNQFRQFLNSTSPQYGMPYSELMEYKLGLHGVHNFGNSMPPIDFSDNENYAQKYDIETENIQLERRKRLGTYLINFLHGQ